MSGIMIILNYNGSRAFLFDLATVLHFLRNDVLWCIIGNMRDGQSTARDE